MYYLILKYFPLPSSAPSHAAIFNVNGTDYGITTIQGTYNANTALLQSQPWWGSQTTSTQFATAVGDSFGFPNFSGFAGPFFSYGVLSGTSNPLITYVDNGGSVVSSNQTSNSTHTYAVATQVEAAVPEPLNVLGASTGAVLLWTVSSRLKRKKLSK